MTDIPYMKLWVSDYEADTLHLTFEEDGAYNRLLRLCWRTSTCSLPADPAWLARRLRATDEEFERFIKPVIAEFWVEENHRISQKRQLQEWGKARHVSDMAKNAINQRWHGRKVIPLKPKQNE